MSHGPFLKATGWDTAAAAPLAGDASTRRYIRLTRGIETAILMDAPVTTPDDRASFNAFRAIGAHLRDLRLSAPKEYHVDPDKGLILMEDLGDQSLAHLLERDPNTAHTAYNTAAGLLTLLKVRPPENLATPDATAMAQMTTVTFDFLPDSTALRDDIQGRLAEALTTHAPGPAVLSLRDVHGDNLMWLPNRHGIARVGLLDFQDALMLPDGYDLASLLDDPRREVPEVWREEMIAAHSTTARIAVLSLQRNLRILGIFRRLSTTMGKPGYAAFLPRTRTLIARAAEALPPLRAPVSDLLDRTAHWTTPMTRPCLILAAGFGTRMGALTAKRPKPLIKVAGRTLLDHALDAAEGAGPITVNAHYRAEQIVEHLRGHDVSIQHEQPDILDSGGAVKLAAQGRTTPMATLNADNVWTGASPFAQLNAAFDPDRMGALLLLVPHAEAVGRMDGGDFTMDADGRLTLDKSPETLVYTGAQILDPTPCVNHPRDVFTLRDIWLDYAAQGRLFGLIHDGQWADIGHPEGIGLAEALLDAV